MRATGTWVEVRDESSLENALQLARGSYQRNILLGFEALSGSTLKGKAKSWGASYANSRHTLLKRLKDAGIPQDETVGKNQKRILVIG